VEAVKLYDVVGVQFHVFLTSDTLRVNCDILYTSGVRFGFLTAKFVDIRLEV